MPDEIADYFYRRGIRKFNANELVFDHYHQVELIEPVNSKIVTKMRIRTPESAAPDGRSAQF